MALTPRAQRILVSRHAGLVTRVDVLYAQTPGTTYMVAVAMC